MPAADDQALIAAIQADPDDEQARLVYADWLEEQGDPRCEVLRLEIAARQDTLQSAPWCRLVKRLAQLIPGISRAWLAEVCRGEIVHCDAHQNNCPRRWERLHPCGGESRLCRRCDLPVRYEYFSIHESPPRSSPDGNFSRPSSRAASLIVGVQRGTDGAVNTENVCVSLFDCHARLVRLQLEAAVRLPDGEAQLHEAVLRLLAHRL